MACGCEKALGFNRSVKTLISMHGIQPWQAQELINDNRKKQVELKQRSPLQHIPVQDGLQHFVKYTTSWVQHLTRERFQQQAIKLLEKRQVPMTQMDRTELADVFDSLDYDRNGMLSHGEWAGGLAFYFKGTQEDHVHAVFDVLDRDGSKTLTKLELREYIKPYVKAMTPPEADALRPLLTNRACDQIYEEMDKDHQHDITSEELVEWYAQGNDLITKIATIIEAEVYTLWMDQQMKNARNGYSKPSSPDVITAGSNNAPVAAQRCLDYGHQDSGKFFTPQPPLGHQDSAKFAEQRPAISRGRSSMGDGPAYNHGYRGGGGSIVMPAPSQEYNAYRSPTPYAIQHQTLRQQMVGSAQQMFGGRR